MSARRGIADCRAEFIGSVIDAAPSQSRACELVASGLLDRAAQIADLAHSLTDAAISTMEIECRERGSDVAALRSLRSAAFKGIVYGIVERIDGRRR